MFFRSAFIKINILFSIFTFSMGFVSFLNNTKLTVAEKASETTRRINMPNLDEYNGDYLPAIFWLGQVDETSNHANVRAAYYQENLSFTLHVFDQWLWYDPSPETLELNEWDAFTIYIQADSNRSNSPSNAAYKFVSQISHFETRNDYQAAYQWNGTGWQEISSAISTSSSWRGTSLNNNNDQDRGWVTTIDIPFSSIGYSSPPPEGTTWAYAIAVHDRDDSSSTNISDQTWPESINPQQPNSWGELHFGEADYQSSSATPMGTTTIRQGLNGVSVEDSHVGGSTNCGAPYDPDFFIGWGNANYKQATQINIQNQWDVADWPCFSKFYVKFPLDSLPTNKEIISATLTMHQFGNANGNEAEPSYIQVLRTENNWSESSITWNNAPIAEENIAGSWVNVLTNFPGWPGVPINWDVTKAVQEAYQDNQSVSLALYSADGDYHSGKYFSSSDTEDWNAQARPTLSITWGNPAFDFEITPKTIHISSQETAQVEISINYANGFNETVSISAPSPSSDIKTTLSSNQLSSPGGNIVLEIEDIRVNPSSTGNLYSIPISADSNSISKSETVYLFINGSQIYLPIILK